MDKSVIIKTTEKTNRGSFSCIHYEIIATFSVSSFTRGKSVNHQREKGKSVFGLPFFFLNPYLFKIIELNTDFQGAISYNGFSPVVSRRENKNN
jgi:hypothetical protein